MAQISPKIWHTPLNGGRARIVRTTDYISINIEANGPCSPSMHIWLTDLAEAVCFVRDLEHALDTLQPGLFFPLPPDDPNEADAMIVHDRADQIERGIK